MTLRNRGEPSGFANLAAPLLSAPVRRATTRNLRLLKKLLEESAPRPKAMPHLAGPRGDDLESERQDCVAVAAAKYGCGWPLSAYTLRRATICPHVKLTWANSSRG